MSVRGVATGWAGSAAVLLVAGVGLGAAHAQADGSPERKAAAATVVIAADPVVSKLKPISIRASAPSMVRPAWLRRLLSRSDLEPARKPS